MNRNNLVKWGILTGLWAVLLIPFYVANTMFFPYISGKNFAFRIIVEIIFALWIYLAYVDGKYRPKKSWLFYAIGLFALVMAVADIFAVNPTKAFLSNFERMDGWITIGHLLMYFVVFSSVMKTEKVWMWFFRSSLAMSMVMFALAMKEWLTTDTVRVSTTLGNAIYVAVYFMFNFFFALILLYKDSIIKAIASSRPWKSIFSNWLTYVYLLAAILCFVGIWRTSTRGVILGLLGGLVVTSIVVAVLEKKNKTIKKISIWCLVVIAVLVGGFMAVKNTQFVQNNPTLNRLAQISWSGVAGQGQARQYVWAMALKGIQEKPILGWGQDGFNYVFNEQYDPRMYAQEQWFDRAHNTPLDVAIAGGMLGLLAYLSIFVASLYIVWKKRNDFGVVGVGLLIGLLAAYFAQNLFVFDNLASYIYFYIVLSYIHSRDVETEEVEDNKPKSSVAEFKNKSITNNKDDIANYVVLPLVLIALCVSVWYLNIKPIKTNTAIIKAMQSYQTLILDDLPQTAIKPYAELTLQNFKEAISGSIIGATEAREQLWTIAPKMAALTKVELSTREAFVKYAADQAYAQVAETPYDARYQLFVGSFFANIGRYDLGIPYLVKALELSPNKISMMLELSRVYGFAGEYKKSLEVIQKARELVPEFNEVKIQYLISLITNDMETEAKKIMGTSTEENEAVVRGYIIKTSVYLRNNNKIGVTTEIQKANKIAAITEIQKAMNFVPAFKSQGQEIIDGINKGTIK